MKNTNTNTNTISIYWFRQDLRLADNLALQEASKYGKILPIYILDALSPQSFALGGASKIYLHHSLLNLNDSLNNHLNFYLGDPEQIILKLIKIYNIKNIFWNRCYEPWYISHDKIIEHKLKSLKINYVIFNSNYLWDPLQIKKDDDSYYKVFSAYKRKVYLFEPRTPVGKPQKLLCVKDDANKIILDDLQLIPEHAWHKKIKEQWEFGENTAQKKLDNFIHHHLSEYKVGRDHPAAQHISKLSPSLHFGEVSPQQIWSFANTIGRAHASAEDVNHFLSEVIWREFSVYLLTHFQELPSENFQNKFNDFPWKKNEKHLTSWKKGQTGYPLVDAGMRELWQTGYMHNRVRMVVASFLVKNLMIHWHDGRDWFWDCLVDADLANNSASWQWVAGSGADAAPYFRIFNPITQGEKFDKNGEYTKNFVPELKNLDSKYLFKPWEAPEETLHAAGIILGKNYPKPIIDLKLSREKALCAYNSLKLT